MSEQAQATEQTNTESVASEVVETSTLVGGSTEEIVQSEAVQEEVKAEETASEETKEEVEIIYEDFKTPEGVTLDEQFTGKFKDVAKELKLNQDQAQKLVDLQTEFTQDYAQKLDHQFKTQVKEWEQESIRELGADYKKEMAVVAKAMNSFGSPELRTLLDQTGLGNHKEVVKLFLNMGKFVSEDRMKDGNLQKQSGKTLEEKHYPNTKSN